MKRKEKYFAIINVLIDINADHNKYYIPLRKCDITRILGIVKTLRDENLNNRRKTGIITYVTEIFMGIYGEINIQNKQIYVLKNNIKEVLQDKYNAIRDYVFEKALFENYNEISYLIRQIL